MSLEGGTKAYGAVLLLSEPYYVMLSLRAKERVRKIDVIKYSNSDKSEGLFTYDIVPWFTGDHDEGVFKNRDVGDCVRSNEYDDLQVNQFEAESALFMFSIDLDFVGMQQGIPTQMFSIYREALCHYVEGHWKDARELFEKCLELHPVDGPSRALKEFIDEHGDKPPDEWEGWRPMP